MTLRDLLPLMNEQVRHLTVTRRTKYGDSDFAYPGVGATACVQRKIGVANDIAGIPDAKLATTVWLLDHPLPIKLDEHFLVEKTGEKLKVRAVEQRRAEGGHTLWKVTLV